MQSPHEMLARLSQVPSESSPDASPTVRKALLLARWLQQRAGELQTSAERRQQAELDRMLQNPSDKHTLARMTDQAFRSQDPHRAVSHLIHILDVQGIPRFFSPWDRTLLRGFQTFGSYAPGVAFPLVKQHLHRETANVILPGERDMLTEHLRRRTSEGVRMNVNFLGEAILSEADAGRRLEQYLTALEWPEIEVVSVKISTLYSQVSALAREHTVSILCERLERLFLAAAQATFLRPDGARVPKLVYLDMEEYRDKDLTAETFMRTLDRPRLQRVRAGIALQAYLPDSWATLQLILAWARRRVTDGGERITIRLVKGANREMERVEASIRGWPQAPYKTKAETDANYKRMLHEMLKPENRACLDIGVASHNLFDLAYGLVLALECNALGHVQFEMLEGMANHQRRALFEVCRNVLLYAPACGKEDFVNAVAYLIRRLDENTGPENFLRHAFRIEVDSPTWERLERSFVAAVRDRGQVSDRPRRTQNRQAPPAQNHAAVSRGWQHFVNEADTDFALRHNSQWAADIVERWHPRCAEHAPDIPRVIAGEERFDERRARPCGDPSRPGVVVGRHCPATSEDIDQALACAAADPDGWRVLPAAERSEVLARVAQEIRCARGDLIGAALAEGGKTIAEADPEVSEAVDFVEFYRESARWWQEQPDVATTPRGVVVVVSPWNFPIAIPCGGVAAALAAGNTVLFKPASDTVLVAWELCQCFWRGGVSRRVLQFVPCAGGEEGRQLTRDPRVAAVILTGGTATAQSMLRDKPDLPLFAETGGKNATIVTALSDRDQAVKHVLHSAFSHSGQKCSATSLLLLEAEIYDDPQFRRMLCDAAASLDVGSAWELKTKIGPLIRPPRGELAQALQTLDPGEEWALAPQNRAHNPQLWSPGIKYGVRPGSTTHLTELFGPVLGVMRFTRLREAIALVNQTGYGLTSGLQSLDEREWEEWQAGIHAGNLYINRVTTGAVVLRQPFGGFAKSVFGPAMKAGGPNYVAQFLQFQDRPHATSDGPQHPHLAELCQAVARAARRLESEEPGELARMTTALASYDRQQREEFGRQHDHFLLLGQDNLRRYLPLREVRIRVHPRDSAFELVARVAAAHVVGCHATVSVPPGCAAEPLKWLEETTESWGAAIEFLEESDDELAHAIRQSWVDRVRYAHPDRVPAEVLRAAAESGVCLISQPVLAEGRVELLWYLHEQSISIDYHRYGNLGSRAAEPRSEPL